MFFQFLNNGEIPNHHGSAEERDIRDKVPPPLPELEAAGRRDGPLDLGSNRRRRAEEPPEEGGSD